jgi:predicted Fe-Mo cluster-binding NifX family protein
VARFRGSPHGHRAASLSLLTRIMTRVALPTWDGRVSPVFDVARHLLIVDLEEMREQGRQVHALSGSEPQARAQTLSAYDVDVLVCGAISRAMEHVLTAAGIQVVSGIRGDVECVVRAFSLGNLDAEPTLHLPGSQQPAGQRDDASGHRSHHRGDVR